MENISRYQVIKKNKFKQNVINICRSSRSLLQFLAIASSPHFKDSLFDFPSHLAAHLVAHALLSQASSKN